MTWIAGFWLLMLRARSSDEIEIGWHEGDYTAGNCRMEGGQRK
jgi:hypothetical protein